VSLDEQGSQVFCLPFLRHKNIEDFKKSKEHWGMPGICARLNSRLPNSVRFLGRNDLWFSYSTIEFLFDPFPRRGRFKYNRCQKFYWPTQITRTNHHTQAELEPRPQGVGVGFLN
jgi:hypothetical protein